MVLGASSGALAGSAVSLMLRGPVGSRAVSTAALVLRALLCEFVDSPAGLLLRAFSGSLACSAAAMVLLTGLEAAIELLPISGMVAVMSLASPSGWLCGWINAGMSTFGFLRKRSLTRSSKSL